MDIIFVSSKKGNFTKRNFIKIYINKYDGDACSFFKEFIGETSQKRNNTIKNREKILRKLFSFTYLIQRIKATSFLSSMFFFFNLAPKTTKTQLIFEM